MTGWASAPLGEVCSIRPPKKEAKQRLGIDDHVSFVRMESLGIRQKGFDTTLTRPLGEVYGGYTYFADGDVLLAKITPCFQNGKLGIARGLRNGVGFGSSEFFVLRCSDQVDPEFLFYFLSGGRFTEQGTARMSGAVGHQRVPLEFVENYPLPLPPLPEQKRIVAILDEAFAAIDKATANAEKALANAREVFETVLRESFNSTGENWDAMTLGSVLHVQPRNGWSPPAAHHSDSGTPVLTLSSVTGFRFRPDKIKYTSAMTDSDRHYWVQNGDLLITRSNTPDLVGHVAIADGLIEPTIYPDLIMRMIPAPNVAATEFLYYQLQTPALRKEIQTRARGANPTMKKLSKAAVQSLPVVVPPLAVQMRVVDTLRLLRDSTDEVARIFSSKQALRAQLRESLLKKAFAGELAPDRADHAHLEAGA